MRKTLAAVFALLVAGTLIPQEAQAAVSPTKKPKIVAHRGESDRYPENSMQGFRGAVYHGADAIELDVRFTKTNVPVVMHDSTMTRTTNCTGLVSSISGAKFESCRIDKPGTSGAPFTKQQPPTLYDALKTISLAEKKVGRKVIVIVEIKGYPSSTSSVITDHQMRRILQRIRLFQGDGRTVLASFSRGNLDKAKKLGFKGKRQYIFPLASNGWNTNYEILNPYPNMASEAQIAQAHARGQQVLDGSSKWSDIVRLMEWGVDYISTNKLAYLRGRIDTHFEDLENQEPEPTPSPTPTLTKTPTPSPTPTPTDTPTPSPTPTPTDSSTP